MQKAVSACLGDLIAAAEGLRRIVDAERPGALLPSFPLIRLGIDVDAMTTSLEQHALKLGTPNAGAKK